jgi:hypothetical protein
VVAAKGGGSGYIAPRRDGSGAERDLGEKRRPRDRRGTSISAESETVSPLPTVGSAGVAFPRRRHGGRSVARKSPRIEPGEGSAGGASPRSYGGGRCARKRRRIESGEGSAVGVVAERGYGRGERTEEGTGGPTNRMSRRTGRNGSVRSGNEHRGGAAQPAAAIPAGRPHHPREPGRAAVSAPSKRSVQSARRRRHVRGGRRTLPESETAGGFASTRPHGTRDGPAASPACRA